MKLFPKSSSNKAKIKGKVPNVILKAFCKMLDKNNK